MDLKIAGRVALVTAGAGGLGSEIVSRLASEGARVALCDINEEHVRQNVALFKADGLDVEGFVTDLSSEEDRGRLIEDVEKSLGEISIFVAITGGPAVGGAVDPELGDWRSAFELMVSPVLDLSRRVLPGMKRQGWGRIIVSTSSGVREPIANLALSNALRSALPAWAKTLAVEVGPFGITVNTVIPGRFSTDRVNSLDLTRAERQNKSIDQVRAASVAGIPIGRYGTPTEYADVVTFVASQSASYVTGSAITVDGGMLKSIY